MNAPLVPLYRSTLLVLPLDTYKFPSGPKAIPRGSVSPPLAAVTNAPSTIPLPAPYLRTLEFPPFVTSRSCAACACAHRTNPNRTPRNQDRLIIIVTLSRARPRPLFFFFSPL